MHQVITCIPKTNSYQGFYATVTCFEFNLAYFHVGLKASEFQIYLFLIPKLTFF